MNQFSLLGCRWLGAALLLPVGLVPALAQVHPAPQNPSLLARLTTAPTVSQQADPVTQPLKKILKDLESRYNVFFTYRSATLENKTVRTPDRLTGNLDKLLDNLLTPVGLQYKKVKNIYVIFSSDEKPETTRSEAIRLLPATGALSTNPDQTTLLASVRSGLVTSRLAESSVSERADRTLSGTVRDENNQPLPGVSVLLKGTQRGTSTDGQGQFRLSVPDQGDATLVFSFVGYVPREITLPGGQTEVNVRMQTDEKSLNEVVVVGYGVRKRSDISGSVGVVNARQIERLPVVNSEQALQGRVAGVNVVQNGGAPGAGASVQIRGIVGVGANEPLYVIDGVTIRPGATDQLGATPLASIAPNDIESISVLKDASAAAIYGASAANGVVIITTKRGKTGAPRVSLDTYYGTQSVNKKIDLLDGEQYRTFANYQRGTAASPRVLGNTNADTDWQDEFFQTAPLSNISLNVGGGTDRGTYSVSGNWFKQGGIVPGTNFDRKSLRVNTDFQLGSRIRLGESLAFSQTRRTGERRLDGGARYINQVLGLSPLIPATDKSDPRYYGYGQPGKDDLLGDPIQNPIAIANLVQNNSPTNRVLGNVYAEGQLIKGLSYRTEYGLDFNAYRGRTFVPAYYRNNGRLETNAYSTSFGTGTVQQWKNLLNYKTVVGKHSIDALLAHEWWFSRDESTGISVTNLPNETATSVSLVDQKDRSSYDGYYERGILSYFGRVDYAYANKYLLTASYRRDKSSKLNPVLYYPAVSVGWRLSEEVFMRNLPFVNNLKLSVGYGVTGDINNVGDYTLSQNLRSQAYYVFNGVSNAGTIVTGNVNPNLRWSKNTGVNIALDGAVLNNRLDFTLEYFDRTTSDLILTNTVNPLSTGIGAALVNTGRISNQGVDFAINYRGQVNKVRYNVGFNGGTVRNRVLELYAGNTNPIIQGSDNDVNVILRPGDPIGAYYGYVAEGYYQTDEQARAQLGKTADKDLPKAGDVRYADLNGNGMIDVGDRTIIGNPIPTFSYGLNANLEWAGVDLTLFFQGVSGNSLANSVRQQTLENATASYNGNRSTAALDYWTPNNPDAAIANPLSSRSANQWFSTRYVEKGDYLRLKNISLGYRLPAGLLNRLGVAQARVYLTAQNLLTITGYKGYDPEVGFTDAGRVLFRGVDAGNYPQPRTFIAGLQIGF